MILKAFDKVDATDIVALIENQVRESRSIDYKTSLPRPEDEAKADFLSDISSFANAAGGDMLYGVAEEKGIPTEIVGLPGIDLDAAMLRLDNLIRDATEPRVTVQMRAVNVAGKGPVLLVHIPKSWVAPHMVTFKNRSRFYTRNNAGKHQMDVGEIRSAFALSEGLPEKIRRFRDERVSRIVTDDMPTPMLAGPKLVFHVIPLVAFSLEYRLDLAQVRSLRAGLNPLGSGSSYSRFNIDGFLTASHDPEDGKQSLGYCQCFRNGIVESVTCRAFGDRDGMLFIRSVASEQDLIRGLAEYFSAMREMSVPPPGVLVASVVGAKGYEMYASAQQMARHGTTAIDRDVVLLPDTVVETWEAEPHTALRPICDGLWNAAGWECSLNYDVNGKWSPYN